MTDDQYPYEIVLEVAFRDIDAMGHVNNAVFFAYFETVRIKYLGDIMEKSGLFGTELLDLPLILVEASCISRSAFPIPDELKQYIADSQRNWTPPAFP